MKIKYIGESRNVDSLGRIVIPKKIRNLFNIKNKDLFDVYIADNNKIIFIKHIEEEI